MAHETWRRNYGGRTHRSKDTESKSQKINHGSQIMKNKSQRRNDEQPNARRTPGGKNHRGETTEEESWGGITKSTTLERRS